MAADCKRGCKYTANSLPFCRTDLSLSRHGEGCCANSHICCRGGAEHGQVSSPPRERGLCLVGAPSLRAWADGTTMRDAACYKTSEHKILSLAAAKAVVCHLHSGRETTITAA